MPAEDAVLFASDVHLTSNEPDSAETFFSFLEGPAMKAGQLFLLGDVFDLWLGDDEKSELADEFAGRACALADAGVMVHFMAGNHDFLLGEDMAERCRMSLLADEAVVALAGSGRKVLMLHGDTLCTDDKPYMKWRAYARDPDNIRRFLAMSLERRQEQRARFEYDAAEKAAGKSGLAVNGKALREVAARHECDLMVHGHVHEAGFHSERAGSLRFERLVLPPWSKGRAGYLSIEKGEISLVAWPAGKVLKKAAAPAKIQPEAEKPPPAAAKPAKKAAKKKPAAAKKGSKAT